MFYFTLHQSRDQNSYMHNEIKFYTKSDWGRMSHIASITWQGDRHNPGWYAFRLNLGHDATDNAEMLEFFNKLTKKLKSVIGQLPSDVMDLILSDGRNFKLSVYDNRVSDVVTVAEYNATEGLYCYKIIIGERYIMDVLAKDETHAKEAAIKQFADEGQIRRLENFVIDGQVKPKNLPYQQVIINIEKWVKNPLQ